MLSFLIPLLLTMLTACITPEPTKVSTPYQEQLKTYWYDGKGEITSYDLKQARYGEMRDGKAVLIFVTEDFSTKTMTKADKPAADNISVMKLNSTRKFNTGIYPYSMMNSTFYPFPDGENSVKISTSSQEWCGHTYLELVDKGNYQIQNHSYFQSEAEKEIKLKKALLEDDLWTKIRLNPQGLPVGKLEVIPSFFYLRFSHNQVKAYSAELSVYASDSTTQYKVTYPELERELVITFETKFPFRILGWEDSFPSGWGENRQKLTTSATAIKSLKVDYWTKNSNADSLWRSKLGLE